MSKKRHHLPKCSVLNTTWATKGTRRQSKITSNKPKALRSIMRGDNTPSPNARESLRPATWPQCTTPAQPIKMTTKRMGGRADADRQNSREITSKASCGLASRRVKVANAIAKAPSSASSPRAACVPVAMVVFYDGVLSVLLSACCWLAGRRLACVPTPSRRRRRTTNASRCSRRWLRDRRLLASEQRDL